MMVGADAYSMIVDADGHIMEPPTMWRDHIDPRQRDLAVTVERDAADGDKLVVAGRRCAAPRRLGGVRPPTQGSSPDWNMLDGLASYVPYGESLTRASYDPAARLAWLDHQGIDATLLFPSIGLIWPRQCGGRIDVVGANVDAYNRWIAEFVAAEPRRLAAAAQTVASADASGPNTDLSALAKRGFRAVMLPLTHPDDGPVYSPRFDRFWGEAEDNDLLICLHKAAIPPLVRPIAEQLPRSDGPTVFDHAIEVLPGQLNLLAILAARLPDRFPRLAFAFLECFAGWAPVTFDRAHESWEVTRRRGQPTLIEPPWRYLKNQQRFFFNLGPGEQPERLSDIAGSLLISSDYPHPDYSETCAEDWKRQVSSLPAAAQSAILGENAASMLKRTAMSAVYS